MRGREGSDCPRVKPHGAPHSENSLLRETGWVGGCEELGVLGTHQERGLGFPSRRKQRQSLE